MQKHFYTHLVDINSLHEALHELGLEGDEKKELIVLVELHIHHVVMDTVLSELPEEDKKTFLSHLSEEKHDDIWKLLQEKMENAEDKIRTAIERLKTELHSDIAEAKES